MPLKNTIVLGVTHQSVAANTLHVAAYPREATQEASRQTDSSARTQRTSVGLLMQFHPPLPSSSSLPPRGTYCGCRDVFSRHFPPLKKKKETRSMISREGPLDRSPPHSDADCSVYNSSEKTSESLGGAAARSTTASCPERRKDRRRTGLVWWLRASESDPGEFWINCRGRKRRVAESFQPHVPRQLTSYPSPPPLSTRLPCAFSARAEQRVLACK